MSQLTFSWPLKQSYAAADFILSPSNAEAAGFLDSWPAGSSGAALLSGPEACGKTHLAMSWAERNRAITIDTKLLGVKDSSSLWHKASHAVLEDIHTVTDEAALFHLLRHAESHTLCLLLTAGENAQHLPFTLADLRSRLLAMPSVAILPPDEALLRGFLFKCFADRQLRVGSEVTDYLLKRMERSFSAAQTLAETIEKRAAESGKPITVALAKSLLS